VDAVADVAGREGYSRLTVERVLEVAGVSRASFYQYFTNLDDCFWTAYRRHAEQLVADAIAASRASREPQLAVLEAVVATALARPSVARLLMCEGLAAGTRGQLERDALIAQLEHAMTAYGAQRSAIDLPPSILIGATFRFLTMRLTDGGEMASIHEDVREWALAFSRPAVQFSWSERLAPACAEQASRPPSWSTGPRPRGTPRERMLRATAAAIRQNGYSDTTVADIVARAEVSRRAFYNEFPSKLDAFVASYEHAFALVLAACTPAFFTSRVWPERVWHGAQAFTRLMAREPLIAYLGFVECYSSGPGFVPRVHDTQLAFTLFLEDGYRQRPEAQSLSRACSTLTTTALFELGFQVIRRGPSAYTVAMHPLAVFIALAPFIGLDSAGEFVVGKQSAHGSGGSVAA
jgi:AcrR family transcriptional regulator